MKLICLAAIALVIGALPSTAPAMTRAQARQWVWHASVHRVAHPPARRMARDAAATACYASSSEDYVWTFGGHTLGRVTLLQDGWCGNGRRITRDLGWSHSTYSWGLWCMTNVSVHAGWDAYPGWKHGQAIGTLGVSYPWGCAGLRSGTATMRIAANGHWDQFDDFGV